jgi:hypothetical protein
MTIYQADIDIFKTNLQHLPTKWEGKTCILELKEANYNWRQMEWWAFYFEYKCRDLLKNSAIQIPGEKFGNVGFDAKGSINWDLKAKAIKCDSRTVILNDKQAMIDTIEQHGFHGEVIALCDVEYNDVDRTFQKWHSELKGGKSKYETERETRTSVSRYRKARAELVEIVLLIIDKDNISFLSEMHQGKNSNGKPRKSKFMLDLDDLAHFEHYIIQF